MSTPTRTPASQAVWSWLVVAGVGLLVVVLVVGLNLFPRLNDAQNLLNAGAPAFNAQRVAGDQAGIANLSHAVNTLDPLVLTSGGASSEVGPLVAFVAKDTHMTPRAVLGALTTNFPHVTALLEAIPLSAANGEIPGLEKYLEGALHVTPAQLLTALQTNFPALYQSISQLPYVVNGWDNVPGTQHLTRFDGSPVNTVPEIRNYFASDVIPVLTAQQRHFSALSSDAGVGYLSPLLLGLGIVVILVGLGFALGARTGRIWRVRATNSAAWTLVTVVGVAVVVLVASLSVFSRLDGGQNLLNQTNPIFNSQRVQGDVPAIAMVAHVVAFADPVVTPQGGASSEVGPLVAFVAKSTGKTPSAVLGALTSNFPHVTALLEAIPLSAITTEIPKLETFLEGALKVTPDQLTAALKTNFPSLYQSISELPYVTNGWNSVPGTAQLTTFSGAKVTTTPEVGAYFASDVVPFVVHQRANYQVVDTTWPELPVFPPLLLIVGILVILFGGFMLVDNAKNGIKESED